MKFSDMMGKGSKATTVEAETTEAVIPPAQHSAPPVPDSPIRFGEPRTDAASAPSSEIAPTALPDAPALTAAAEGPSFADVIAELVPRRAEPATAVKAAASASTEQVDTSAWLDGITSVVDDLLPSNP